MDNKIYECLQCDKKYPSYYGLWRHKKIKHSIKPDDNELEQDDEEMANNICKYCGKILAERKSRWRHENKTCQKNPELIKERHTNNVNINNSNDFNVIQNQTNNITNNITFNFNPLGKEDLMELTNDEKEIILNDGLHSLTTLIKLLNFNNNLPQNHTYCNTNLNNKYINALNIDTKEIEKLRKIDFFDKVLICSLAHLKKLNENNYDGIKHDDFTKQIEQLETYIYFKPEYKKIYIEEINAICYNKRKEVQNTWNKILLGK
jgi:hypothetical protein